MARKVKTVSLENKIVEIKELRVKEITDLFYYDSGIRLTDLKKFFIEYLPRVSNLTFEDIQDLSGSEIKLLWGTFKEVNVDFIDVFNSLGIWEHIAPMLKQFQKAISQDLNTISAN